MKGRLMSKNTVAELRGNFAKLYKEYTTKEKNFQGEDQCNIRKICAKVRTLAAAPEWIGADAVDWLIFEKEGGIAHAGKWGEIPQKTSRIIFIPIVTAMLTTSMSFTKISKLQYEAWRRAFFTTTKKDYHLVFNRLVFACFPTQFCSVIDVERLRDVCQLLQREHVVNLKENDVEQMDWYDLCDAIVPIVHMAFPEKDYADQTTFLAAIGEALNANVKSKKIGH
jgi:hypothetical protein